MPTPPTVPRRIGQAVKGTPGAKFPKSAHLLKHADFQRVYEKGKRHFSGHLTVFYWRREAEVAGETLLADSSPAPRVGFTVGRVLGGAVVRNRIRRRTREAVRQYYSRYPAMPVDIVIHPKKTVLKLEFAELMREVERALVVVEQRTTTRPKMAEAAPVVEHSLKVKTNPV